MFRSLPIAAFVIASICASFAMAQTACFPTAIGVPGQPGPPPFWSSTAGDPNTPRVDDPRWNGAYQQAFASDGLRMRALTYRDGSQDYLLVAWDIRVDGGLNITTNDRIVLGVFDPVTASAKALRIELVRRKSSSLNIAGNETLFGGYSTGVDTAFDVHVYDGSVASGSVTWSTTELPTPGWTADLRFDGYYVRTAAPPVTRCENWRVQARFPIGGTGGLPLDPAGTFRMFSLVNLEVAGGGTTTYRWPSGATGAPFPPLSSWTDARLGTGGTGCTLGVSIDYSLINTDNPMQHQIQVPAATGSTSIANVFHARPRNNDITNLNSNELHANFRLANWGSFVGDSPRWEAVPGCDDAVGPNSVIATGSNADISCTWNTGVRQRCIYVDPTDSRCAGLTPPFDPTTETRHDHQCMLVTLSSTNPAVVFSTQSAYRNMDFVPASDFERLATIDIGDEGPADVYLVVSEHNMPPMSEHQIDGVMSLERIRALASRLQNAGGHGDEGGSGDQQTVFEQLTAMGVPTYETYVFRDTGDHDGALKVFEPMPSFGFFIGHEGDLYGWETNIEGAERIAPNVWVVHVPESGVANVRTVIMAGEASDAVLPTFGDVPQPPCFSDNCDRCALNPDEPGCEPETPPVVEEHHPWLMWIFLAVLVLGLIGFGVWWSRRRD
jgi:hypothetical protein